jgi:hypothetical protein
VKVITFDESKHPRHPAGTPQGGEFAPADAMLDEFYKKSFAHPFDHRQRLLGNVGVGLAKHEGNVLFQFITSYEKKNAGQASSALKWVTALADKHKVTMKLDVKPIPNAGAREGKNLNKKQLHDWYARSGFKGGEYMTRTPSSGLSVPPKFKPKK